jgi:hypothetical protein
MSKEMDEIEMTREATRTHGVEIPIPEEEIERINLRAMGYSGEGGNPKKFLLPREFILDLLFFRMIFKHMLDENAQPGGPCVLPTSFVDEIPLASFQRVLERLFYVLVDKDGFDAKGYDIDANGSVGWGEFLDVCRHRQIVIRLSLPERIFYTLDRPETSYLAQYVSIFVLLVIATSSSSYIMSTTSFFQDEPVGENEPVPKPYFQIIEKVCLWIFVVEYLARLLTCTTVRSEVVDRDKLFTITTGHDEICVPSPVRRLISFVLSPANVIDFAAILPGVLATFCPSLADSSGGFVVLRLIRLTRVFRAPAIKEPAGVILVTIQRSAKALFVLIVNLGLGVIIFGSLMYLVEKGKWDASDRTYQRPTGRTWNANTVKWEQVTDTSPFVSIPHTFWWAIVTATTVGYGDNYPTTSLGYIIAVTTMMFSMLIAALPIGVVGGVFSSVWDELEKSKKSLREANRAEDLIVKASLQKFAPFESMSKLLTIDVWNDRFPKHECKGWAVPIDNNPLKGDFMGTARIHLDKVLALGNTPSSKELTVELCPDHEMVKRRVAGAVTLRFQWTPGEEGEVDARFSGRETSASEEEKLNGSLVVTVVSAERLINLNCRCQGSLSNPYCLVLCFPKSPARTGDPVQPRMWRSPTAMGTLQPRWDCSHEFRYDWTTPTSAFPTPNRWRKSRSCMTSGNEDSSDCEPEEALRGVARNGAKEQPLADATTPHGAAAESEAELPNTVQELTPLESFHPVQTDRTD